jgi:hypothetical protein
MAFVTFSGASNGTGNAADQAKYRTQTTLGIKPRVRGDTFIALGDFQQTRFMQLGPGGRKMFAAFYFEATLGYFVAINDGTSSRFLNIAPTSFTPSATAWYVVRIGITPSATTARLYDGAGTPLYAEATGAAATMSTATGDGELTIGDAGTNRVLTMDGIGIYSALLSDTGIGNVPATGDANILGAYLFTEGTGSSAADIVGGGTALTLAGTYAWGSSGATWPVSGPAFTAPAPATNYSGAQGTTVPIPSGAFNRNGNSNTLTVRVNGTLPTGVTLASVNVTNPTSTFAVDLVIAGSAPLVTADPFTLELVDGATVVATLALTVTVTAAASTTAGGASNATTELDSGIVLFDLYDTAGALLTTASPTIRVAPVGSDTFVNRTATYRGEPGRYRYTLTSGERPTTGIATIVGPNGDAIYVAVVEPGTMFSGTTTLANKFAQLAQGVLITSVPIAIGPDGVRRVAPNNDLVVDVPLFLFGAGRTVRCRVAGVPEGDPAALGGLELTAMTETGPLYTGLFDRTPWNAVASGRVNRSLWLHYDDGDRHYVREIKVVEYLSLGV